MSFKTKIAKSWFALPLRVVVAGLIFCGSISLWAYTFNKPAPVGITEYPSRTMAGDAWGYCIAGQYPANWGEVKSNILGKVKAKRSEGGTCYIATIEDPSVIIFEFSRQMGVPTKDTYYQNYLIDQQFVDDVTTHEQWHSDIYECYYEKVWKPLEDWLKAYSSNEFKEAGKAEQKAKADINLAFETLRQQQVKFSEDKNKGHPTEGTATYESGKVVSHKHDWGKQAYDAVNAYAPDYDKTKQPGDCPCGEP